VYGLGIIIYEGFHMGNSIKLACCQFDIVHRLIRVPQCNLIMGRREDPRTGPFLSLDSYLEVHIQREKTRGQRTCVLTLLRSRARHDAIVERHGSIVSRTISSCEDLCPSVRHARLQQTPCIQVGSTNVSCFVQITFHLVSRPISLLTFPGRRAIGRFPAP